MLKQCIFHIFLTSFIVSQRDTAVSHWDIEISHCDTKCTVRYGEFLQRFYDVKHC